MPNLDHDPTNPTDLLDRPIAVGDIVAWGTTYGRSPALCIARIEKIRFTRKAPPGNWRVVNEECPQHMAEDYQLRLRPIKSTGRRTMIDTHTGKAVYRIPEGADPDRYESRPVTITLVKNVVKLEAADAPTS